MNKQEIETKAAEYKELQNMIKELQDEAETIKTALVSHMESEDTDKIVAGPFTVRWAPYTTSRLDSTALKKELPEVAERYSKTSEVWKFQVA
jgi:predicted phage-related endonuclease